MRSNIKRAALSLALSFLAGCIVNIPEQEGTRPDNGDMPADLAKDSSQDLNTDMLKPGTPVRIEAPQTFSLSEEVLRPLAELKAVAVDAMGIPNPEVPLTYQPSEGAPFIEISGENIKAASVGKGALEISSPGLETVTVEVQVIATQKLELPPTIYLDVTEELPLMDLSRGITAPDERELLKFAVEGDQIAKIEDDSIKGIARGETKLTATLLHLSQEIRVVVRKPVKDILISPPMLRLLANNAQGDNFKEASFEVVSLDEDGLVRELAPDETLCEKAELSMVDDDSWSIIESLKPASIKGSFETSSAGTNQYKLKFTKDVVGFGSLRIDCQRKGRDYPSNALVEVVFDKQVAAGGAHSCATKEDAPGAPRLQCWGSNELSALGRKREGYMPEPAPPELGGLRSPIVNDILSGQVWLLDAGQSSTCAVEVGGAVSCSGAKLMLLNSRFQPIGLPKNPDNTTAKVIDVSVGVAHACAVTQDGALYCWGDNSLGQLGQGDTAPRREFKPMNDSVVEAVQVDATRKWARVSAGSQHTCALDVYGQAFCWGHNGFGRLGDGTEESRLRPVAVSDFLVVTEPPNNEPDKPLKLRFVSIAAADTHTCGVERSGSVYCWGQNHQGRLGQDHGPLSFSSPQLISGGALMERFALDIDSSAGSVCALVRRPGEKVRAVCWGENSKGQLGRPASTAQITPELLPSPPNRHILDLAMGAEHGCLTLQGETAPRCWGAQQNNRLGDNQNGFSDYFKTISFPTNIKSSSFQSNHGCVALDSVLGTMENDSNVYCWGLNHFKQAKSELTSAFTIGNTLNAFSVQLSDVRNAREPKDSMVTQVFTGASHSCGLDADGFAFCWGGNWAKQSNPESSSPMIQARMAIVSTATKYSQLAVGQGFTCGLVKESSNGVKIACWGAGELGRLGNGMKMSCPDADTTCGVVDDQGEILGSRIEFSHIATAFTTTCAIGKEDTRLGIYCWGAKVSKDNMKVEQADTAVKVWERTGFQAFALAAGDAHFCALVGDGASPSQLLCWGDNSFGEVTGEAAPWVHLPTAVPMINVSDVSSVALGSDHTCLLRSPSSQLSCWGRNNVNQLGAPDQPFIRSPKDPNYSPRLSEVTPIPNVTKLLGGASSTCVQNVNTVYCVGDNAYRQLGGNPPGDIAPTPELVKNF